MNFNQAIHQKSKDLADLVIRKQKDYGKGNILGCPVGAEMGIIVRLFDKINRLANLYKRGKAPTNESLIDTWTDIVGYGLIGLMVSDGQFELPMEENEN